MKKMSKRAAWKYLAKLWASPIYSGCDYYVKIGVKECFGLCYCIQNLDFNGNISFSTRVYMLEDIRSHAPKTNYGGYRWSCQSINGAKARSRFCLKMAEKENKSVQGD